MVDEEVSCSQVLHHPGIVQGKRSRCGTECCLETNTSFNVNILSKVRNLRT